MRPTDARILELKEAREAKDRLSTLWHAANERAADATDLAETTELEWSEARRRVKTLEQAINEECPGYLDPYQEDRSRWTVPRTVSGPKGEG